MIVDFFNENYTLIVVVFGTMLLGIASGAIGTITILRKQALIGDVLSHATLPGVVVAFILTGQKEIWVLLLGAAGASIIAMTLLTFIKKYTKVKYDASLALILSGFFGLGQVLLVYVQTSGNAAQAGLDKFIFGQAATIVRKDVFLLAYISIGIVLLLLIFWKEIKHFVFNQEHFKTLGFSSFILNTLIMGLVIIVVVVGIRSVGVILMSALLIAPGVAARQWSNKLSLNVLLASLFGMLSGATGAYISATQSDLPTGPVVVIVLSFFVVLSLMFAPKRGMVYQFINNGKYKKQMILYKPLIHIFAGNPIDILSDEELNGLIDDGMISYELEKIVITEKGRLMLEELLGGH